MTHDLMIHYTAPAINIKYVSKMIFISNVNYIIGEIGTYQVCTNIVPGITVPVGRKYSTIVVHRCPSGHAVRDPTEETPTLLEVR